jgi:hypothetical protein
MVNTAPQLLYPRKKKYPVLTVQEAGCAPGPVWTGAETIAPHRVSIPGPFSPKRVAIPTELPQPPIWWLGIKIQAYLSFISPPYLHVRNFILNQNTLKKRGANQNTCVRRLKWRQKLWTAGDIHLFRTTVKVRGWSLETYGGTNRNRSTITSSVLRDKRLCWF